MLILKTLTSGPKHGYAIAVAIEAGRLTNFAWKKVPLSSPTPAGRLRNCCERVENLGDESARQVSTGSLRPVDGIYRCESSNLEPAGARRSSRDGAV